MESVDDMDRGFLYNGDRANEEEVDGCSIHRFMALFWEF